MLKRVVFAFLALLLLVAGVIGFSWRRNVSGPGDSEAIEFVSGEVTLRGVLMTPQGEGPHPVIVFLHGSGPEEIGIGYYASANAFVRAGVAVLAWDKRGAGESGGDFETAEFADFIADIHAGLAFLRAREDIDRSAIGLFGTSEGAWFSPQIAIEDGEIAYIINRVAPTLPWSDVNIYESQVELRAAGVPEDQIATATDLRWRIWEYYRDADAAGDPLPDRRAALEAELAGHEGSTWREHWRMGVAEYGRDKYARWVRDTFYDPRPWLEQLDIPLLTLYAGADQNVPTEASIAELERLRAQTGLEVEIIVYPGLRHSMFHWSRLLDAGFPAGYFDAIGEFAARHSGR